MLTYGSSPQGTNPDVVAPVSKKITGPGPSLPSGPGIKYQGKETHNCAACSPKVLKMNKKKKAKVKFEVTDDQLDKLATILCDLFHNESVPPMSNSRESLTALLS